jgi:hypothetical protein
MSRLKELVDSIDNFTPSGYHYCGDTLKEFWAVELANDYGLESSSMLTLLLDGSAKPAQLAEIAEELTAHAECGAVWNYVRVAKTVDVGVEVGVVKALLLEDRNEWEDPNDSVDRIASTYMHYKIGAYEVFSFQIDSTEVGK